VPNSLAHEYKTYSAPASITDIPGSASYGASSIDVPANHPMISATPIDQHPMKFSMPQQSVINPNAFHSSLFPGYQEPQTSLSSTPPQVTSEMVGQNWTQNW
jgi:hypothetical protein